MMCDFSEDKNPVKMKCSNCCPHTVNCPQTGVCRLKDSVTQTSLLLYPEKLILQLERFTNNGNKIKTLLSSEPFLQLGSEMYQLISLVDHIGDSMQNGHYIAHVQHGNMWMRCDDSTIAMESDKILNSYESSVICGMTDSSKLWMGISYV